MRVFKKPNLSNGWKCLICGKSDEKEVTLVMNPESYKEGSKIVTAEQVHLDCLDLWYDSKEKVIYQVVEQ